MTTIVRKRQRQEAKNSGPRLGWRPGAQIQNRRICFVWPIDSLYSWRTNQTLNWRSHRRPLLLLWFRREFRRPKVDQRARGRRGGNPLEMTFPVEVLAKSQLCRIPQKNLPIHENCCVVRRKKSSNIMLPSRFDQGNKGPHAFF